MANDGFPRLPTLEAVIAATKPSLWRVLSGTALVCCQHLLETTGSLFECLFRNGLRPNHTFIVGKVYSTNAYVACALRAMGCHVINGSAPKIPGIHSKAIQSDATEMWHRVEATLGKGMVSSIVTLDDGAYMRSSSISNIGKFQKAGKIVGVEQTMSGLPSKVQYPVINVATSAVKRHFEPSFVSRAVWDRVQKYFRIPETKVGIIGLGNIGVALSVLLQQKGLAVFGYDVDRSRLKTREQFHQCNSVIELIQRTDVIFGCTGCDSVPPIDAFTNVVGRKTFASCSSSDIEFRPLLLDPHISWKALPTNTDGCATLEADFLDKILSMCILRSGYPVNFDNTRESIPQEDIQLTRGLLLGAVLQSLDLIARAQVPQIDTIMLNPVVQKIVDDAWLSTTRRVPINCADWYQRESDGIVVPCEAW